MLNLSDLNRHACTGLVLTALTVTSAIGQSCPRLERHLPAYPLHCSAIAGSLVVAGQQSQLVSIDRATGVKIDSLMTGLVHDIELVGDHAYLATSSNGLRVVDISDPAQLALVGEAPTGSRAERLTISGQLVFVATASTGLRILDVSDPAAPAAVGEILDGEELLDVAVSGSLAVVGGRNGLYFVDVSDPSLPQLIFNLAEPNVYNWRVLLEGDVAYVATRLKVKILDIGDPAVPATIAERDVFQALELAKLGDVLFVGHTSGFLGLDVSMTPSLPVITNITTFEGFVQDLVLDGNELFMTQSALRGYDVTTPSDPQESFLFEPIISRVQDVAVVGDVAWVPSPFSAFDLAGDAEPSPIFVDDSIAASAIEARGDLVYLDARQAGEPERLMIFDTTAPAAPSLVGSVVADMNAFALSGDYLYGATSAGLLVVDISDPATPQIVTTVGSESLSRIATGSQAVFAQTGQNTVLIYDLADPASPIFVEQYQTPAVSLRDLSYDGGDLLLSTWNGIEVVDVSDLANPQLIGSSDDGPTTGAQRFISPYLYTSQGNQIRVYDLADRSQPRLASRLDLPAGPGMSLETIAPWNGQLVAGGEVGLMVLGSCAGFADGFESGDVSRWELAVP